MKENQKTKKPLSRTSILKKAMEIIDNEGIKALSMRSLGTKLNVEAMSLYNHVTNKDDIISGVLDLIVGEISVPEEGGDWKEALEKFALSARTVLKKHPWAGSLMDSHLSSGPARLHYYNAIIGTLSGAGFSIKQASQAFSLIDSYIYGFALQQSFVESGRAGNNDHYNEKESILQFRENIPGNSYPYLIRMTEWALENGTDPEEDFRFGIKLILSGLERIVS